MPAGTSLLAAEPSVTPDAFSSVAGISLYGFQKLPPVTSSISTLNDWYLGSVTPILGIAEASMLALAATAPEAQIARAEAARAATEMPDNAFCIACLPPE